MLQFEKNYSYNIRHSYGKEGKRTDYTPFSCMKIITRVEPKGDECHGTFPKSLYLLVMATQICLAVQLVWHLR